MKRVEFEDRELRESHPKERTAIGVGLRRKGVLNSIFPGRSLDEKKKEMCESEGRRKI